MMRALIVVAGLLLGCSVRPCDEGQVTDSVGFCVVAPATGSSGGSAGATSGAGGASEAGGAADAACDNPTNFGDSCASDAQCNCNTDYCAIQPGSTTGMCTSKGCVEDPGICPQAWSCLDLATFDPTLPSFCVPPE